MIKYSITSVRTQDYLDMFNWCKEHIDGFEQKHPIGVNGFGYIIGAELHFPDNEDAMLHFMITWSGTVEDLELWPV